MTAKLANDECLFAPHWNKCKDYIHVTKVHFINLVNPDIINNNPNIYIFWNEKVYLYDSRTCTNKREDRAHTQEGKKCLLFIQMPRLSNDAIECICWY